MKASLVLEVRKLGFSKLIAFANFLGFEVFRILTIFRLFDNFLTNLLLTPPPLAISYPTIIWVALFNESIDEFILSIEVSSVAIFYFEIKR